MRGILLSFLLLLLITIVRSCPDGWTQAPDGGDCFQIMDFYNNLIPDYYARTFDDAEGYCSSHAGGLLASIHNQEEQEFIMGMYCKNGGASRNIGLKCKGKDCKWDDGSAVTYTNFAVGNEPQNDGVTRCYGVQTSWKQQHNVWTERNCGSEKACWVCRVKTKTIECVDGETEYKGGCVSVHVSPLDQKTAEASCPGGGHLVSIHSGDENNFYMRLALDAGVAGTAFIGEQFSDGVTEWTDGTNCNSCSSHWANGFPNTIFGDCVQMLLASEFGVQGQWTNIDCSIKQPYICFRDGTNYTQPSIPLKPKADAKCPPIQYYSLMGNIFSPNYPLSIPSDQGCEYVIGTLEGTRASIKFTVYDCQSGTSISLFDGLNADSPFTTITTAPPSANQYYTATSNVLKIVFSANGTSKPVGTGWEVEFTGLFDE